MPITRLRSTPSSTVAMKTVSQTSCRCINNTNKGTLTCTYRKPQLASYTATCNYRSIVTCVSPPYPVTQEIQRRRKQQTESYSTHVKVLYDIHVHIKLLTLIHARYTQLLYTHLCTMSGKESLKYRYRSANCLNIPYNSTQMIDASTAYKTEVHAQVKDKIPIHCICIHDTTFTRHAIQ